MPFMPQDRLRIHRIGRQAHDLPAHIPIVGQKVLHNGSHGRAVPVAGLGILPGPFNQFTLRIAGFGNLLADFQPGFNSIVYWTVCPSMFNLAVGHGPQSGPEGFVTTPTIKFFLFRVGLVPGVTGLVQPGVLPQTGCVAGFFEVNVRQAVRNSNGTDCFG